MTKAKKALPPTLVTKAALCDSGFIIPCVDYFDTFHQMVLKHVEGITGNTEIFTNGWIDQFGDWYSEEDAKSMRNHLDGLEGEVRIVLCAAMKYGREVYLAPRHFHSVFRKWFIETKKHEYPRNYAKSSIVQGFIDQDGNFMTRAEALEVAIKSGQVNRLRPKTDPKNILFSEDLY